nr:zinc finger, CCHC-type [Tanacetum cinerariifolium]
MNEAFKPVPYFIKGQGNNAVQSSLLFILFLEGCKYQGKKLDPARLKAYEERIKGAEKMEDSQGGLLLASDGKSHGCKHCGGGSSNRDDFGSGRGRGRGSVRGRDGNERVRDKSHVKCYKCGDYGQYNNECPKNEEANLILEELTLF